jgi:hypothetical protein
MNDMNFGPVILAALLCIFVYLQNKLLSAIQSKRLELARRGEVLLASQALNAEAKDYVRFLLNHAFGMRVILIFELISIPFIVLIIMFRISLLDTTVHSAINDKGVRLDLIELETLHNEITWANNPFLNMIVEIEYSILISLAVVIRLIFFETAPTIAKDMIVRILEKARAKLERPFRPRAA